MQDLDIETVYFIYTCSKNQHIRLISLGLIYLYVGIYYVCALFFTFKTSKVKIKGLDGAKYIATLVYTTSIVIALTSISLLLLRQYINAYAMVYSFGFWFGNIAILGFLFFPKVFGALDYKFHHELIVMLIATDGSTIQGSRR